MIEQLKAFIEESTTAYQTVQTVKKQLLDAGYVEILEKDSWDLANGKGYFVTRNDSSLIAFQMPKKEFVGFHMICAHGDSPALKIKENPELKTDKYNKLNVEKYGGMIVDTWFDRPLSVAGRIVVSDTEASKNGIKLKSIPVDFKKPLFMIPSLAIHMTDKQADAKRSVQNHMLALTGMELQDEFFVESLAKLAGVEKADILGMDLYLYVCDRPQILGLNKEFFSSPRLDDLACVYSGLCALLDSSKSDKVKVLGVFDNEEVGSSTMQGAQSNFLMQTLSRICKGDADQKLANSFLISADNAHALHPNYTSKADLTNKPILNEGIVIKYHAGQKYTTSAYSGAYVKAICQKGNIAYQCYHNHSDIAGGSTLGNIATQTVSVPAADIGIAQLAMHSAYETMGTKDLAYMVEFMSAFFAQ